MLGGIIAAGTFASHSVIAGESAALPGQSFAPHEPTRGAAASSARPAKRSLVPAPCRATALRATLSPRTTPARSETISVHNVSANSCKLTVSALTIRAVGRARIEVSAAAGRSGELTLAPGEGAVLRIADAGSCVASSITPPAEGVLTISLGFPAGSLAVGAADRGSFGLDLNCALAVSPFSRSTS